MLPLEDFRTKLLAQRRELFRQAAQTEEDLLWLETDVEPEAMERGRTETMVRWLDCRPCLRRRPVWPAARHVKH